MPTFTNNSTRQVRVDRHVVRDDGTSENVPLLVAPGQSAHVSDDFAEVLECMPWYDDAEFTVS